MIFIILVVTEPNALGLSATEIGCIEEACVCACVRARASSAYMCNWNGEEKSFEIETRKNGIINSKSTFNNGPEIMMTMADAIQGDQLCMETHSHSAHFIFNFNFK